MEDQDEFIVLKSDGEKQGLQNDNKTALEDTEHNADLYIANQEVNTQNWYVPDYSAQRSRSEFCLG